MTNAEAIKVIDQVRKIIVNNNSWLKSAIDVVNEATDMAIKALEVSSPCDLCVNNPPSSMDGKPCSYCPAEPTIDNM